MLNTLEHHESAAALGLILQYLAANSYRFITPTPLTHQRALAHRGEQMAADLRDVFGWNLPFKSASCEGMTRELLAAMRGAGVLQTRGDVLQSRVRVASVGDDLFLHSGFPTAQDDAVFFGPDTYRFAQFIQQCLAADALPAQAPVRVLDVGCGSGAGGMVVARAWGQSGGLKIIMNDINPVALQYAAINAAHAHLANVVVKPALGNALRAVKGDFDLIISNPPYLVDTAQRAYRHGGERLGRALSVRIGQEALSRLAPGGRMLLYTGVAIVNGVDGFLAEMQPLLADKDSNIKFDWNYSEIDPDVFGEELEQPAYKHIDRIAAVGLSVTRRLGAM